MMVTCAGCERPILDRFLFNVLDRAWHAKCVQCSDCSAPLTEKCFSREGKLYCREDFFRRFGTKCAGCLEGISPNDLVRRARNQVFHLKCFTCMICRKQLSTGEELYILDENKFICKDDYLNRKYEGTSDGEENMDNDTEHAELEKLEPSLSDKEDTMDSGEGTVPTPLPLTDSKDDLNRSLDSPLSNPPPLAAQDHAQNCPSVPGANSTGSANASEEAPSPLADDDLVSDSLEKDGIDSKAINNNNNGDGANRENQDAPAGTKKRGPRTTIKAKQLETLKAAFAATPKPTRHIREQLAKETGLNMRVIQVWFQNRRSKERRMKQLSALGARRHFFRNPRRMRMDGLSPADLDDNPDMLGQQGFSYPFPDGAPGDLIPGYQGYGDFFPPGQPGEPGMNFVPTSSGPQGAPGLLDQHQGPLGANGQFLPPNDFPTSEPHIPPLQPPQDGLFPQGPPPTSLPSGFGQALGHQQREMTAETW